uniref:Putative secreted protein n=1 Tax=Anopheles darlingi TaxID=43151 RepID=A0A2M4D8F0_ANODA
MSTRKQSYNCTLFGSVFLFLFFSFGSSIQAYPNTYSMVRETYHLNAHYHGQSVTFRVFQFDLDDQINPCYLDYKP